MSVQSLQRLTCAFGVVVLRHWTFFVVNKLKAVPGLPMLECLAYFPGKARFDSAASCKTTDN